MKMTTTTTPKAMYLELRRENATSQVLLIPQVTNPSKGKTQKSKLITRQISTSNPRRSWRYYSFKTVPLLEPTASPVRALMDAQTLTNEIGPFLAGYSAGGWKLVYQPLAVEMSSDDLNDVWDANTPNALMRRVLKARSEAGFPDALFDETLSVEHPRTVIAPAISDEVKAYISENFTGYDKATEVDPNLAELVSAVFSQESNAELAGILDSYTNKGTALRGRGNQAVKEKVVKVSEVAPETEGVTEYTRPNGQKYVTRKWGEHDDVMVLRKAREASQFVMLYGAPGTGKTALVEAAFGEELLTILGSGDTEVADLVGGYVQTPMGGFSWVDGPLIKAAEEGKPLLIDEIGLIDPKVLSIVYGLMDGRREYRVTANPERGTVRAEEGFYVVAATNPNAPGVRLSEALLSRFGIQAEVTTDWNIARKRGVAKLIVTVAQNLSKKQASGEVSWSPQFRELEDFQKNENLFGTSFAISTLLACAPEMDRPVVQDVLSRAYGENILPARI
jgi:hypothetical protein